VTKLVIQIPCFNEASSLPITLAQLPRAVEGFDVVEWLVINDGSVDGTEEVARECGVDHVVTLPENRGLAAAFIAGLNESLRAGADVIVNTDADNQYQAADIPSLTRPILAQKADIVVGARPITQIEHFSPAKKVLQRLGSWVLRSVSSTSVDDAPSGFRAFSRDAALKLRVWGKYTYTLETLIQAGTSGLRVRSVPIGVNPDLRPSRLVKSSASYVSRSMRTIFLMYLLYRPFRFFARLGAVAFVLGIILYARWIYLNIYDTPVTGRLHIPSLIAGSVLLGIALQMWIFGLIAELMATNRKLLEEIRCEQRRAQLDRETSTPLSSHGASSTRAG
jgi:glycosyltransferase involved in cell wall biosynthesis